MPGNKIDNDGTEILRSTQNDEGSRRHAEQREASQPAMHGEEILRSAQKDEGSRRHAEQREASHAARRGEEDLRSAQNDVVVEVLGVRVTGLTLPALLDRVSGFITTGGRYQVMYANIHVLNTAYGDPELRGILNEADLVYCDGAGVKLGARLLGGSLPQRMTGADWIYDLCAQCEQEGYSLFFLGGKPGVADRAAEVLSARYSGLKVVGTHHGYIHDDSSQARGGSAQAIATVNAACPDILLVGMGTPVQERWLAAHRQALDVPVCWTIGALFDYVAGVVPRGPRWMLDHGLEWLYRLYVEPGRLGQRYLIGNPLFLLRVLRQRFFCMEDNS